MLEKILVIDNTKRDSEIICNSLKEHSFQPTLIMTIGDVYEIINIKNGYDYFAAIVSTTMPELDDGEIADYLLEFDIPVFIKAPIYDDSLKEFMEQKEILDFLGGDRLADLNFVIDSIKQLRRNRYKKVLTVRNTDTNYSFNIEKHLRKMQFYVIEAYSAKDVEKEFIIHPDISLVLIDYSVDNDFGHSIVIKLRRNNTKDSLVIVEIIDSKKQMFKDKFLKYSANSYLQKPFGKEELNYIVNNSFDASINSFKQKEYLDILDKNMALVTIDTKGYITYVTDLFLEIADYPLKSDYIDKHFKILFEKYNIELLHEDIWDKVMYAQTWEDTLTHNDKSIKYRIEPYRNSIGRVVSFNAIISLEDSER